MPMTTHNPRYGRFNTIREATQLAMVHDEPDQIEFHKMVQTGKLTHFDYGVGFLNFETMASFQAQAKTWHIRIWMANIDDGDFGGWSAPMTKDKVWSGVRKIAYNIMMNMVVFPTEVELNKLLLPYGVQVDRE